MVLARRVVASLEMITTILLSYVPANIVRVTVLRVFGAHIGPGTVLCHGLQVRSARRIRIGKDCYISENVILDGRGGLTIGDHVGVGPRVQIWSAQHDWTSPEFAYSAAPVIIGDRCWINCGSIVLPGADVGNGVVAAAGSVVTGSLPDWVLAGGVPAKELHTRPLADYELSARRHRPLWW